MPPLVSPCPMILDHSFPRSCADLRLVSVALGELQLMAEDGALCILLTDVLAEFIDSIDWQRQGAEQSLLREVYRFLVNLFLYEGPYCVRVDVNSVVGHDPHPLPRGYNSAGLVEWWSDELGKLLAKHDCHCAGSQFFVGVACARAFAESAICEYENCNTRRFFPLVGPNTVNSLEDAFEWEVPNDYRLSSVEFLQAKRNCQVLGATKVAPPSSGSHYKVGFANGCSWILDRNLSPIPDNFLRQLEPITGYPLPVIKYAMIEGKLPRRFLRI